MLARLLPGAEHLQNPHPLFVHFPIAFLYGAALLYAIGWLMRRDAIAFAALWLLVLGAVSAALAAYTGWWSAAGVMLDPSVKEHVLQPHMRIMVATTAIAIVLAIWALIERPMPPASRRYIFMAGVIVMIALITKGADLGGIMVYDYNGGGGACPQPIPYVADRAPVR